MMTADTHTVSPSQRLVDTKKGLPKRQCSGRIESIELIDFMCHHHLLVQLDSRVNFIIGNNGSGKSAILTALIVALGSRANLTQRALCMDSLIKEGASTGKVRLKIFNNGDNSYLPDLYGECLVIERVIKRNGPNSYHIYNSSGRIVSSRKEDVILICDHFGIQVDNPLAVLTQEVAKKFLANARPNELYEFFMKATQLEQLSVDYSYTERRIEDSRSTLEFSKNTLTNLLESIKVLEKELVELEKYRQTHQRIQSLREELTWAMVAGQERENEQLSNQVQLRREKIENLKQKIATVQEEWRKANESVIALEDGITQSSLKIQPLLEQKMNVSNEMRQIDKFIAELTADARVINEEFTLARQQIQESEDLLKKKEAGSPEHQILQLKSNLSALEDKLARINREIGEKREAERKVEVARFNASSKLNKISERKSALSRLIESNHSSIKQAGTWKNNRVKMYGDQMGEALEEIKRRSHEFSRPPLGPIGLLIKLKENQWSMAMEAILHGNLETFIVNNHADRKILSEILNSKNLKSPIVVLGFDGDLNYSSGLPSSDLKTPLDILEFENPVVKKLLIIMTSMESYVLLNDRSAAIKVARQRPKNVNAVYTQSQRINMGQRTISVINLFVDQNKPRLAEDLDFQIKNLRNQLATNEKEVPLLEREEKQVSEELKNYNQELTSIGRTINDLERQFKLTRNEISKIQESINDLTSSETDEFYKTEHLLLEEKLEALKAQFQANHTQLNARKMRREELTSAISAIEESIKAIREEDEGYNAELNSRIRKRAEYGKNLTDLQDIIKQEERQLTENDAQLAAHDAKLSKMREAALKLCERVDTKRTVSEIDAELTAQERILQSATQVNRDPRVLHQELASKRLQYQTSEQAFSLNTRILEQLYNSLQERERAWIEFRRSISKMSCTDFVFMLSSRGFTGSLEYKHHDRELNIRVIPQAQAMAIANSDRKRPRQESSGRLSDSPSRLENRDVKQLSGGEKSYSTACFLFSLWQTMGSPFRCLDEFDVYMDPINRAFITQLLIDHAKMSNVQFILITPNAVPGDFSGMEGVMIHRLQDPQRNDIIS